MITTEITGPRLVILQLQHGTDRGSGALTGYSAGFGDVMIMTDQLGEIRSQLETLRDEYQDDVASQTEHVGGIIHGLNEALRIVESVSANQHPPHRSQTGQAD